MSSMLFAADQDSYDAGIKRIAEQYGQGHKHMLRCQTCGYIHWHYTQTDQPDGVTVADDVVGHNCPRCAFVGQRHPELLSWVLNVLAHFERHHVKTMHPEDLAP